MSPNTCPLCVRSIQEGRDGGQQRVQWQRRSPSPPAPLPRGERGVSFCPPPSRGRVARSAGRGGAAPQSAAAAPTQEHLWRLRFFSSFRYKHPKPFGLSLSKPCDPASTGSARTVPGRSPSLRAQPSNPERAPETLAFQFAFQPFRLTLSLAKGRSRDTRQRPSSARTVRNETRIGMR